MKLEKLPKRKVTVDELIHSDDIADLLKDIYEKRAQIDQFVLIYTDEGGVPLSWWHGTKERLLWALEITKRNLLNGTFDEEKEDESSD